MTVYQTLPANATTDDLSSEMTEDEALAALKVDLVLLMALCRRWEERSKRWADERAAEKAARS